MKDLIKTGIVWTLVAWFCFVLAMMTVARINTYFSMLNNQGLYSLEFAKPLTAICLWFFFCALIHGCVNLWMALMKMLISVTKAADAYLAQCNPGNGAEN